MDICRVLNGAYLEPETHCFANFSSGSLETPFSSGVQESYASKVVARNCWVNRFLIAEFWSGNTSKLSRTRGRLPTHGTLVPLC